MDKQIKELVAVKNTMSSMTITGENNIMTMAACLQVMNQIIKELTDMDKSEDKEPLKESANE